MYSLIKWEIKFNQKFDVFRTKIDRDRERNIDYSQIAQKCELQRIFAHTRGNKCSEMACKCNMKRTCVKIPWMVHLVFFRSLKSDHFVCKISLCLDYMVDI